MCVCDEGGYCARCRDRWPLDRDPYYQDPSELEQERRERDISQPDFLKPHAKEIL